MRTSSLLLVLAACGGGGSSETLEVKLADTVVAAVKSGDRWEAIARDANNTGKVTLDGPTVLAIVCDSAYLNYYTLFLGPGMPEDEPFDLSCGNVLASVEVTIAAPTTTQVFIGFSRNFNGDPISVAPGIHDVIAVDRSTTPPKFEIRRDVAITGPMTLTIAPSQPMVATRIDATVGAGETLFRSTSLITGNRTFASVTGTEANGWTFPASVIQAGDKQSVSASTSSETLGSRSARRTITSDTPTVALELPGYLTSVTPTPTSATWAGGAEWTSFYYGINSADFSILWDASVHPEWTAAGGKIDTIAFPDPAGIPGWRSEWNLGATAGYEWYFSASHETGTASRNGEL
jgi:hypothetical protein